MKLYQIILLVVALICVISPTTLFVAGDDAASSSSSSKPPLERQPARVGAWKDIDISNPNAEGMADLIKVASTAVSQLPMHGHGPLKITRLVKAKRQIVNGIKYEFVLDLANADNVETYTLLVWQQRDKVELLEWASGDIHAIEDEIAESEESSDDSGSSSDEDGSEWPASDVDDLFDDDEDNDDDESEEDGDNDDVASANPNLSQDELDEISAWLDSESDSAPSSPESSQP